MIKKWQLTYPAFSGEEKRNAYVYIPAEAKRHPERRYPVLYMFDGHNVFFDSDATYGKSWGMKKYMDKTKTPMIIAAVECNHSPNGGRISEYSPFSFTNEKLGEVVGRGKETMEWLVNVFKPEIDRRFPTLPDREHTFIAGSSMGGLMSLYALLEYNSVFSKAASLSPSIWFAEEKLDAMIKNAKIVPDTAIYIDYGARELPHHKNMADRFREVANLLFDRRIDIACRIVPNGDHCEASWERQIPLFMDILRYGEK